MSFLVGIITWIKSNIIVSIVIGSVITGAVVVTPIVINYYQEKQVNQEEKDNSNSEQPKQVTCEEGFYKKDNECVSIDGVINLNNDYSVFAFSAGAELWKESYQKYIVDFAASPWPAEEIITACWGNAKCHVSEIPQSLIDELKTSPGIREVVVENSTILKYPTLKIDYLRLGSFGDLKKEEQLEKELSWLKYTGRNGLFYSKYKLTQITTYNIEMPTESYGIADDDPFFKWGYKKSHILNEEICKDYNLTCGRW